jgi:hypothetical protein
VRRPTRDALAIGAVVIVGMGLRAVLAVAVPGNFDEQSFELVAAIGRRGGNVFVETTRYNYTPVWALLLQGFDDVATRVDLPLHVVVRSALSIVDVANAMLIGLLGQRVTGRSFRTGFAAYLLNPVAVLIVGYHGQFETLAALPLLAALVFDTRGTRTWLLGTLSLVVKHILAFQVWLLFVYAFGSRRAVIVTGVSALCFAATFIPYLPAGGPGIVHNVFGYSGLHGFYGLSSVLPYEVALAVCVAALLSLPLFARRMRLGAIAAMRLSGVAMLAVIYGIGEQYFLIPILFAAPFGGRWYWIYSAVATAFLLASPNNLHVIEVPPPWNAVWLVALAWTAWLAIGAARDHGDRVLGRDASANGSRGLATGDPAGSTPATTASSPMRAKTPTNAK